MASLTIGALLLCRFNIQPVFAATETLTVTGDSATESSGWAAEGGNYLRLQNDDGDTNRLYTPSALDTRYLVISDTAVSASDTINSVTVYGKTRSLDPVANTFQICVKVSATNYCSANKDTVTSTSYILFSETWTTNPNTGTAWTPTTVNAMEAGLKKINAVGMGWTYTYVVVDYTAAAPPAASSPFVPRIMWFF